jgi:hypothetical protein
VAEPVSTGDSFGGALQSFLKFLNQMVGEVLSHGAPMECAGRDDAGPLYLVVLTPHFDGKHAAVNDILRVAGRSWACGVVTLYPEFGIPGDYGVRFCLRGNYLEAVDILQAFQQSLANLGRAILVAQRADVDFLDGVKGVRVLRRASSSIHGNEREKNSTAEKQKSSAPQTNRPFFAHRSRHGILDEH